MAVSAVIADWSGARYVNGSNESLEDYMTIDRVESNMNTTDYNLKEFELNTENGVTVGYKGKDYKFTIEITSSGNSAKVIYEGNNEGFGGDTEENFADVVTDASYYGDYVEYPIDINEDENLSNDWRIFYNDGKRVFLISADYVPNNSSYLNNEATGMIAYTEGTYSLYWNPGPSSAQDVSQASLFGQTMWTDYSTNENARCVSALLNTNNWTGFVDSTYGEYAIGGPTIEMWISSYNAKGYTPLYCNNQNSNGYYIDCIDHPTETNHNVYTDINPGYDDTLYFPYQTVLNGCEGYWIASPSSYNEISLNVINSFGNVGYRGRAAIYYAVRPVIALKENISATKEENNIWTFTD